LSAAPIISKINKNTDHFRYSLQAYNESTHMDRSRAIWPEICGLFMARFRILPPPTRKVRSYLSSAASKPFVYPIGLIPETVLVLGIAKTRCRS
jgi:hypothetical protein